MSSAEEGVTEYWSSCHLFVKQEHRLVSPMKISVAVGVPMQVGSKS